MSARRAPSWSKDRSSSSASGAGSSIASGGLALDYLVRLAAAYARFFHDYAGAPLLVVNSNNLNFVDCDSDFELLLQRIRGHQGLREYFSLG